MAVEDFGFFRRDEGADGGGSAGVSGSATFCRFAPRLTGEIGSGGLSELDSGAPRVFRFREGGAAGCGLAAGWLGVCAKDSAAASLAEERVTLEDMRKCFLIH